MQALGEHSDRLSEGNTMQSPYSVACGVLKDLLQIRTCHVIHAWHHTASLLEPMKQYGRVYKFKMDS